jgi:hypothetical protein
MSSDANVPIDASVNGDAPPPLPPPESSDAAATAGASDAANGAETYYKAEGSSLKVLVAMCHGVCINGSPVLPLNAEPWKSFPVAQICPTRDVYAKEVTRRWTNGVKKGDSVHAKKNCPRPKQWNLPMILEWLEQNPIEDSIDIAFLIDAVEDRKAIADAAQREEIDNNARLSAGNWNSTACLRLIHALVDHDEIKSKFLNRLNLPAGRSTFEHREHNWATDVWHLLANKWNDKNFAPEIMSLPQLHTEFALLDIILHSEVAALTPATADKVEDKWASMILEMNRCIANWQKSGQGEGGIDDVDNAEDQVFGSLANRSLHTLASRQSFFSDRQAYLLYLWEMLDRHDLLGSALQKLSSSVSSTNGASGVPSVVRASENDAVT